MYRINIIQQFERSLFGITVKATEMKNHYHKIKI